MSAVIYRAEVAHTCTTGTGEPRAGPGLMRTFVGPGVEELIHSATIAVAGQVPIGRLWHAVPCSLQQRSLLHLLEAYRG